jgi:hypothetical protein
MTSAKNSTSGALGSGEGTPGRALECHAAGVLRYWSSWRASRGGVPRSLLARDPASRALKVIRDATVLQHRAWAARPATSAPPVPGTADQVAVSVDRRSWSETGVRSWAPTMNDATRAAEQERHALPPRSADSRRIRQGRHDARRTAECLANRATRRRSSLRTCSTRYSIRWRTVDWSSPQFRPATTPPSRALQAVLAVTPAHAPRRTILSSRSPPQARRRDTSRPSAGATPAASQTRASKETPGVAELC